MHYQNVSFNFKNKIVLITGGSKGIGKGLCKSFLNSGARVFYVSRKPIKNTEYNKAIHIEADLSKDKDIKNIFSLVDSLGSLDILINSAAINFSKKFDKINKNEWNEVVNINLSSIFSVCQEALLRMKKRKSGKIVNISSIAGRHRSYVAGVHYVASKSGLIGLTKQLAFEVAKYNINVNAVCPSQTLTPMLKKSMNQSQINKLIKNIPMNRLAEVKDQIATIMFLCSDGAEYITGTYVDVNGGQI